MLFDSSTGAREDSTIRPAGLEELYDGISLKVFPEATAKSRVVKVGILEAFMQSVQEVGFAKTSYDTIAKRANTSRARVHYHFDNIEKMNQHAVYYIYFFGQYYTRRRIDAVEGWQDKVLGFADGAVDWIENHPNHMTILLLSYYQACIDEEYRKLYDDTRNLGRKRFFSTIENVFPKDKYDTLGCVVYLQRVLFGALIELSCSSKKSDFEKARQSMKRDYLSGLSRLIAGEGF